MRSGGKINAGEGLKIYDPEGGGFLSDGLPELTYVDWGILEPAQNATRDMIVENKNLRAITLRMTTSSWVPSLAMSYITLEWNYTGTKVNPSNTIPIMLILRVSPLIENITDFSFDITVFGDS